MSMESQLSDQACQEQDLLALHDFHKTYCDFDAFRSELPSLLNSQAALQTAMASIHALGIIEPITHHHILPSSIQISPTNLRESVSANSIVSRNRAVLRVIELVSDPETVLSERSICLAERVTAMASWMKHNVGEIAISEDMVSSLVSSEPEDVQFLAEGEVPQAVNGLDLLIIQDRFSAVKDMDAFFGKILQFLRHDGRLLATFPMNYGRVESIVQESETEQVLIPGWEILAQASRAGFKHAMMHLVSSWKYGILSSKLPGVLVMELCR